MQQVSQFFNAPSSRFRPNEKPLSEFERDAVVYFFAKLKIVDSRFYDSIMPDETTERITKREFADMIRGFTKEKIDKGFAELNRLMAFGHEDYKYLKIQTVIGLVANNGSHESNQVGSFRVFPRFLEIEDQTAKAARIELGIKNSSGLLAMLDEPSEQEIGVVESESYGKAKLEEAKLRLAKKEVL